MAIVRNLGYLRHIEGTHSLPFNNKLFTTAILTIMQAIICAVKQHFLGCCMRYTVWGVQLFSFLVTHKDRLN
jgi:hypothetical protein